MLFGAVELETAKWSIDILATGGKGTCVNKADGVLVDGKCVKAGRWEEGAGYGLESEMAETCAVSRKEKDYSWKRTWREM